MEQAMFCYQCQETAGCRGCTRAGVCGKTPETAALQDLLVYVTKGLAAVAVRLRAEGVSRPPPHEPSDHPESFHHHYQRKF